MIITFQFQLRLHNMISKYSLIFPLAFIIFIITIVCVAPSQGSSPRKEYRGQPILSKDVAIPDQNLPTTTDDDRLWPPPDRQNEDRNIINDYDYEFPDRNELSNQENNDKIRVDSGDIEGGTEEIKSTVGESLPRNERSAQLAIKKVIPLTKDVDIPGAIEKGFALESSAEYPKLPGTFDHSNLGDRGRQKKSKSVTQSANRYQINVVDLDSVKGARDNTRQPSSAMRGPHSTVHGTLFTVTSRPDKTITKFTSRPLISLQRDKDKSKERKTNSSINITPIAVNNNGSGSLTVSESFGPQSAPRRLLQDWGVRKVTEHQTNLNDVVRTHSLEPRTVYQSTTSMNGERTTNLHHKNLSLKETTYSHTVEPTRSEPEFRKRNTATSLQSSDNVSPVKENHIARSRSILNNSFTSIFEPWRSTAALNIDENLSSITSNDRRTNMASQNMNYKTITSASKESLTEVTSDNTSTKEFTTKSLSIENILTEGSLIAKPVTRKSSTERSSALRYFIPGGHTTDVSPTEEFNDDMSSNENLSTKNSSTKRISTQQSLDGGYPNEVSFNKKRLTENLPTEKHFTEELRTEGNLAEQFSTRGLQTDGSPNKVSVTKSSLTRSSTEGSLNGGSMTKKSSTERSSSVRSLITASFPGGHVSPTDVSPTEEYFTDISSNKNLSTKDSSIKTISTKQSLIEGYPNQESFTERPLNENSPTERYFTEESYTERNLAEGSSNGRFTTNGSTNEEFSIKSSSTKSSTEGLFSEGSSTKEMSTEASFTNEFSIEESSIMASSTEGYSTETISTKNISTDHNGGYVSRESEQRLEYNEDEIADIYWPCPPSRFVTNGSSKERFTWYKLSYNAKNITPLNFNIDLISNALEIKNPRTDDEGRYACMSSHSSIFHQSSIHLHQFIILKQKWVDIGLKSNVSIYFNQKLILNCPHGDILLNGSRLKSECSSRVTIVDRYPASSPDVLTCTDSPHQTTTKLQATLSATNCSYSLGGCPSIEDKDQYINHGRCLDQGTYASESWTAGQRHPGKIFIRFYFDARLYQCFPFESDIYGYDYHSFTSMEECENHCYFIKAGIQRCFHLQNIDNDQLCADGPGGQYLATYNIVNNKCQWFFRKNQCPISKNSFASMKACRQTCIYHSKAILMNLKKACVYRGSNVSAPRDEVVKWVYEPDNGQCLEYNVSLSGQPFVMSFDTKDACQMCKLEHSKDLCLTKPQNGRCQKQEISWHFNYLSAECVQILDGGCGDSLNRFRTKVDCLRVCAKHLTRVSTSSPMDAGNNKSIGTTIAAHNTTGDNKRRVQRHLATIDPRKELMTTTESTRTTLTPKSFDFETRWLDKDPCFGATLHGSCDYGIHRQNYTMVRYKFMPQLVQCHRVHYSGCQGGQNLFDDSNECKSACEYRLYSALKSKRCQPPYLHNCLNQTIHKDSVHIIRYYFSLADNKCLPFNTLDNRRCLTQFFSSIDECHKRCRPKPATEAILQNKCFGDVVIDSSSCEINHRVQAWFYMPKIGQCLQFTTCPVVYRGNVFVSRAECEDSCLATNIFTVCSLPVDHGIGSNVKMRYYFDIQQRKCVLFFYNGSLGNSNRFRDYDECFNICVRVMLEMEYEPDTSTMMEQISMISMDFQGTSTNISDLLEDADFEYCYDSHKFGACVHVEPQIYLTKYYYNGYRRRCEPYLFSGCGPTSRNSFDAFVVCDRMCAARIQRTMSPICLQKTYQCLNSSWTYWRYNPERGTCELYPSCVQSLPSGEALFTDEENCSQTCVPHFPLRKDLFDICHLPSPKKNVNPECTSPTKRWFYDHQSGVCISAIMCHGYGNNFPSLLTCSQWCSPNDSRDVCRLPKDSGPCTSNHSLYFYFDWETQTCKNFTYGGCLGNRNRFLTVRDCMKVCLVRNKCNIHTKTAGCRIHVDPSTEHYLYNGSRNRCERINETVCGNVLDFYSSKDICENDCVVTDEFKSVVFSDRKDSSVVGDSRCVARLRFNNYPICSKSQDWLPRYYHDNDKMECVFFYYNGCDGSKDRGNRFMTISLCQHTCLGTQVPSTVSSTPWRHTTTSSIARSKDWKGVCPRSDNVCSSLVTISKTCQSDSDCADSQKCCGCKVGLSLTKLCVEPLGCMLSSYGCCAGTKLIATDAIHSNCARTPATIVSIHKSRSHGGVQSDFSLECLVTGDPRPDIIWTHVNTSRNVSVNTEWDLTRPQWAGVLKFTAASATTEGIWLCIVDNGIGHDDLEFFVSVSSVSHETDVKQTLLAYDYGHLNTTIKPVSLGSNILIHCPIYGVPNPTITWFHNNISLIESNSHILVHRRYINLINAKHRDDGSWRCVATQNISTMTLSIQLIIQEPISILPSPHGNVIKATIGQPVSLYCNVIGRPRPNITWFKDGVMTKQPWADARILVVPSFTESNRGTYVCHAINDVSERSASFIVTSRGVNDILVHPAGFHFVGDSISLHCPPRLVDSIHQIIWKKDNIEIARNKLHLELMLHSKLDSGFYTCHDGGEMYQTHVYVHVRPVD